MAPSESATTPTEENSQSLTNEYNPDDEQSDEQVSYGWDFNEGLDNPEEVDKEEEVVDEDAEYAKGKPVGYDLDND